MGRSRGTQLLLALSAAAAAAASASGGIMPVVEAAAAEIGGMLTAVSTGQHGEHTVGRVRFPRPPDRYSMLDCSTQQRE